MHALESGIALVMEGSELKGIFSERDLLGRIVAVRKDPSTTQVSDVMTEAPEVLEEGATVAQAMRVIARAPFRHMPLVDAQTYFRLYQDQLKPGVEPPGVMATDEEIEAAYERIPQATAVEIFVDNPDDIQNMRERIQAGLERPLILSDWQQNNETFFSALQVERVVMFTILSMIILVAAFNIISSLVMLVKDKGADIAILRTMGATRSSIMRIFSMTGTAIGVAGTFVGLVAGLLIASYAEPLRAFISDLVGGIRVTVIEEESTRRIVSTD